MMTNQRPTSSEMLSALADGELTLDATPSEWAAALAAGPQYSDWNTYQVIGQALKSSNSAVGADAVFLQRLNKRLADEKIAPLNFETLEVAPALAVTKPLAQAANDGSFRWKLVAGFASFGAVAAVAWSLTAAPGVSVAPQLAGVQPPDQVLVASPLGPMVRDARLIELMAAHKQLGGSSLQAPSGFLRNAGLEDSQNGQRR